MLALTTAAPRSSTVDVTRPRTAAGRPDAGATQGLEPHVPPPSVQEPYELDRFVSPWFAPPWEP